jgi:hypothetical protein
MSEVVEIVINAITEQSVDSVMTLSGAFRAVTGVIDTCKQALDGAMELVREFGEEEVSIAKLNAVLKATGRESAATRDSMLSLADSMQKTTMFADEEIINAQALMATFKSINDDIFPESIKLTADLAATFGMDLRSATVMLGKALEDPIIGMGALRRVGVSLNEESVRSVKAFVEVGEKAKAQAIILDEVRRQVGGVAEAMGETAPGKLKKFDNAMSNVKESCGKAIWDGLEPLVDAATKSTDTLSGGLATFLDSWGTSLGKNLENMTQMFKPKWIEGELKKLGIIIKDWNDDTALSIRQTKAEQEKMEKVMLGSASSAGKYGQMVAESERKATEAKRKAETEDVEMHQKKLARIKEEEKARDDVLKKEKARQNEALEAIGERTDRELAVEKRKWAAIESAMGHGLTAEQELQKKAAQATEKQMKDLEKLSRNVISGTVDAFNEGFKAFGAALVKGEDANKAFWKAFGNAGKEMIAKVLEMFGTEWAQLAVAAALAFDFIGAIGYGLASAAAFTGAGIVRAIPMARGGEMTVSRPTHFLAGEAGAERVRVTPLEKEGEPASGTPRRVVLSIGGKEITAYMQEQIDRGALRLKRA